MFFFLETLSLHSQSITWSSPIDIAPSVYGNNHPRITLDNAGNPFILWGNMSTKKAWFSKWNGTSFTTPVTLNPTGIPVFAASWAGPDIASFGDTLYVIYKETPEDTNHIYITTSFDGGNNFSLPVQVDNIGSDISRFPVVSVDSVGNPLVGFMHFEPMWMNPQYVVCRSSDFGNTFNTEISASGFSGGQVCDCCPATLISGSGFTTMLYRDNLSNIRNMWAGVSTDGGATFNNGIAIDQTNWPYNSCPSSGPDGVIIGDSLYAVFMSGATGNFLVYHSTSSLTNLTSGNSIAMTGPIPGLNSQNFPRIASSDNAVAIAWLQNSNNSDRILFQFTSDIVQNGFPSQIDTIISGGQLANTDVALSPGEIHIVWENSTTGTVKYQKGTYATTYLTEQSAKEDVSLYPNPASSLLHVKMHNGGNITTVLFDINGHIVLPETLSVNDVIPLGNLVSGFYTLMIKSENGIYFRKVFKK
jgi:hypothetical protein